MKKLLWFSRHAMSVAQLKGLTDKFGSVHVTQVSASPANVHVPFEASVPEDGETVAESILTGSCPSLKELVAGFDEVAVVMPINMLQQLLPLSPSKRLLQSRNKRIMLDQGKVQFEFDGWEAVTKVEVVTTPL